MGQCQILRHCGKWAIRRDLVNWATDDLYAFALPKIKEIQIPDNVHFTESGSKFLAQQVARSILAALPATDRSRDRRRRPGTRCSVRRDVKGDRLK